MRNIKFRVWDKKTKNMIYNPLGFPEMYPLNTLMQYTELEDQNGNEIYEGDILFCTDENYKGVVSFNNGCFVSDCCGWGDEPLIKTGLCVDIVGNIKENPELLED